MSLRKILCTIVGCVLWCISYSQTTSERVISEWRAGMSLTEEMLANYDVAELFASEAISEEIFARIKGLSYKENCTVPIGELRYLRLLHYNANGQVTMGEMICNRRISDDMLYIFRGLFAAKYPIESLRLVDDFYADDNLSMINNNSSSFNFRYISGTTKLSSHSLGLAVDINPLYNPYVKERSGHLYVEPVEAKGYVDRTKDFPYKIGTTDLCYKLFLERGFEWGGSWSSVKDYQHFEKSE